MAAAGPGIAADGQGQARPRKGRIREESRRRILDAAERIFARHGFAGATMAEIAQSIGMPKANIHYYFGTKEELYRALVVDIVEEWRHTSDCLTVDAEPRAAITQFLREKLDLTRRRPHAAKVFGEVNARAVPADDQDYLEDVRRVLESKGQVIDAWVAAKKIQPVDGRHFLMALWAMTQYYADFDGQMRGVLGKPGLTEPDWGYIADQVVSYALRVLGIE
ncbi:MAG TPA: TetR family transcriptional regulator [Rhodospirillaceae bacterium]|nr:TetR family transcriptional regulator [Rhodospirillaceae bacterium]